MADMEEIQDALNEQTETILKAIDRRKGIEALETVSDLQVISEAMTRIAQMAHPQYLDFRHTENPASGASMTLRLDKTTLSLEFDFDSERLIDHKVESCPST